MGRETAAALNRWAALQDHPVPPRLAAVCDVDPDVLPWFERIETVRLLSTDYRDLLGDDRLEVLYIAVPHHLHEELYLAAIEAGKDFLGEKPFGIDLPAAERILAVLQRDAVLPRGPGGGALDRLGSDRAGHRGERRVPPLQRPRSGEADQLEASGGAVWPGRGDGRPGHARPPPPLQARMASHPRLRGAAGPGGRASRAGRLARALRHGRERYPPLHGRRS